MLPLAFLAVLLALPQDPVAKEVKAFKHLKPDRQVEVVRDLEERIRHDPDPVIQMIVSRAKPFDSYPEATPHEFNDPVKWTQGKAPKRKLVRARTAAHRRVRQKFPEVPFLTDLHKAVWYDWGTGRVVRRATPLTAAESFENLLRGYPPGADAAVAQALQALDNDPAQRPVAAYLDHLYADLKHRMYEDITLYEAWYTGDILDVPDVDAIAFAVEILHTDEYQAPIPRGPARAQLYEKIREHMLAQRRYRSLREAAAGALVRAEPIIDPTYDPFVPRFHYLWPDLGDDPERVAKWLADHKDRTAFIARTDARFAADPEAYERRENRRKSLAAAQEKVRALAVAALEQAK